jgi:hypothetical protein
VVSGLDRMHVIFLDRVHGLESTWLWANARSWASWRLARAGLVVPFFRKETWFCVFPKVGCSNWPLFFLNSGWPLCSQAHK